MKKQTGFTLVELVIVIVILSVLTATVLPRFVNLEEKATEAVLKGALTSVKSAARIGNVYARTESANAAGNHVIDGDEIFMVNQYPIARANDISATGPGTFSGIVTLLEIDPAVNVIYSDNTTVRTSNQADDDTLILYSGNMCVSYQPPQAAGDDPAYSAGVLTYNAAANTCL